MAAPSITVVNAATNTTIPNWSVGVVKANNSSTVLSIQIWNNRGGSTDLADLRDASITSLDIDGGNSSDPVANKWLHVNVPEMDGASSWTPVGGTSTKFIRGDTVTATEGNIIKGTANDGNASTTASKVNYTTVNLRVDVPVNATPNTYNFKTRINGYYVG
jgi:hypothetical protein